MKELKKSDPNSKVLAVTYVCVALFLALAVYMGYFLQVKSEDVINNPYNARLDSFSDRIVRGSILAADGTVLAETTTDDGGNETRVYNYGSVFDHAVGYSSKGKTGIEAMANFYLLSSHVNLVEQAGNELAGAKNLGDSVVTTLDMELQQTAYAALGDRRGAVIAMEPDTGKILAMVSKPGYDPNTLLQDWAALTDSSIPGNKYKLRLLGIWIQSIASIKRGLDLKAGSRAHGCFYSKHGPSNQLRNL